MLNEIEVVNDKSGKPFFNFSGTTGINIKAMSILKIHLSLSHQKNMACASVVIEQ